MTVALEAIREELALLRPRLGALEQAEALLASAYEPPTPRPAVDRYGPSAAAVAAAPAVGAPRPRDARPRVTRAQVRDYVVAEGPVRRGEILTGLGLRPSTLDKKLKRLLDDREIAADGRAGARHYRAPGRSTRRTAARAPSPAPERGVYPVYDAIGDCGGSATTPQLAAATGLPASLVVEQGRRLTRLRLVRFAGVGGKRVWTTDGASAGGPA
jgi:hypothetical protein